MLMASGSGGLKHPFHFTDGIAKGTRQFKGLWLKASVCSRNNLAIRTRNIQSPMDEISSPLDSTWMGIFHVCQGDYILF